jgi:hypothetical protein
VGHNGDTPFATSLIGGTIPHMEFKRMPETQRILETLARPFPALPQSLAVISPEEFVASYKAAKESTSSSPSGCHIGHYKAAIGDPALNELHSSMMSIPFQVGFVPDRWQRITDIMLEKKPGDSRCHRLRIIALFESDLNQAKQILIGR